MIDEEDDEEDFRTKNKMPLQKKRLRTTNIHVSRMHAKVLVNARRAANQSMHTGAAFGRSPEGWGARRALKEKFVLPPMGFQNSSLNVLLFLYSQY